MEIKALTSEQSRVLINATQVFQSLQSLRTQERSIQGSMHWKKIAGKEYLYRGFTGGKTQSLGPRCNETEQIKQQFEANKKQHKMAMSGLQKQVKKQAGYIRLNGLNRFPVIAARMLRALQKEGIPHRVIGTNSIYAYEAGAGISFTNIADEEFNLLATDDLDVMLDHRQGVQIATAIKEQTLLTVLKQAVPDLVKVSGASNEYSAITPDGYMIDFVTQAGHPMKGQDFNRLLQNDDLQPVEIESLKWLASAPAYAATVFDTQGYPLQLETVDPRAFALHKWFVAQQPERQATKKERDRRQAIAVSQLVKNRLTDLPYGKALQRIFPGSVNEMRQDLDNYSF